MTCYQLKDGLIMKEKICGNCKNIEFWTTIGDSGSILYRCKKCHHYDGDNKNDVLLARLLHFFDEYYQDHRLNIDKNIRRKKLFLEEYYHGLFTNLIKKFDKLDKDILTDLSCNLVNSNHHLDFHMLELYFHYLSVDSEDLPILPPPDFLISNK